MGRLLLAYHPAHVYEVKGKAKLSCVDVDIVHAGCGGGGDSVVVNLSITMPMAKAAVHDIEEAAVYVSAETRAAITKRKLGFTQAACCMCPIIDSAPAGLPHNAPHSLYAQCSQQDSQVHVPALLNGCQGILSLFRAEQW